MLIRRTNSSSHVNFRYYALWAAFKQSSDLVISFPVDALGDRIYYPGLLHKNVLENKTSFLSRYITKDTRWSPAFRKALLDCAHRWASSFLLPTTAAQSKINTVFTQADWLFLSFEGLPAPSCMSIRKWEDSFSLKSQPDHLSLCKSSLRRLSQDVALPGVC